MNAGADARWLALLVFALAAATAGASPAGSDIHVAIANGRVSIVATNASIADIVTEWARVGGTKMVNADKIPRDTVTLELRDVSERQALDILLRATSGYILGRRETADPTASLFDRLVVMPPSVAPPFMNAAAEPGPTARSMPARPVPPEPRIGLQTYADGSVESPDNDSSDHLNSPPPLSMEWVATPPQMTQTPSTSRHALETVNPRDFRLPPMHGGTTPGGGGAFPFPTSSAVPGVIVLPASAPPPGQPR